MSERDLTQLILEYACLAARNSHLRKRKQWVCLLKKTIDTHMDCIESRASLKTVISLILDVEEANAKIQTGV